MKANDKTLQVIRVYKEYLPRFYNSINYKFDIIDVILSNEDFVDDVLGFIKFAEENKMSRECITQTLMHDMGGMFKQDEHFLPRIHGYSNLTKA